MRTFRCECGNALYFENTRCLSCQRELGFLPDALTVSALETSSGGECIALAPEALGRRYRKCRNYFEQDACNWMVPAEEVDEYCLACRLNEVIPNLDKPGNRALWIRIEQRKRRLIHDLRHHRLPVVPRSSQPDTGLGFAFMEDNPGNLEFRAHDQGSPILTGHAGGLITINIAEADDVERERMRVQMNEQQRTLLGHFRHESGHYYWDRLVADGAMLQRVRDCFGDERQDYASSLERYYADGARDNWQDEFVSAYASAHPWEDWAECWGHLLQINDTLETAVAIGLAPPEALGGTMEQRAGHWVGLALKINQLNRSLDQPDPYPFVLTSTIVAKLALVDEIIRNSGYTP